MKTILVDAVNTFVIKGKGIFEDMYKLLEKYPNRKIVVTNADDGQIFIFRDMPYPVFTLNKSPEKTNPDYFTLLLKHFNFNAKDVIYFEHNLDAVKSAESVGITAFHYDEDKQDLSALKKFLDENL